MIEADVAPHNVPAYERTLQTTRRLLGPGIEWLVASVVVATALRCLRLEQNSLWFDEVTSLLTARAPLAELPAVALEGHALNPPLYFWLLHVVLSVLGESETALRLISVIAGILTIPLMWLLAREITGSTRAANLSGVLLAIHPLHIWFSQEARPYALLVLLQAAALYCLAVALKGRGRRWWAGFVVSSSLAILTHVFGLIHLLVGASWVVFRPHRRALLGRYVIVTLGILAIVSPFLILLARAALAVHGTGSPPRTLTGAEIPYTLFTFLAGFSFGPSVRELQDLGARAAILGNLWQVSLVGLALFVLGWPIVRLRGAGVRDLVPIMVVPIAVIIGGSVFTTKPYSVRYVLPALLGFLPLVALALVRLRPVAQRGAVAALLGLLLWADAQWFTTPKYWKEDSRAMVACLAQVLPSGATVLVTPSYMDSPLQHYSAREGFTFDIQGVKVPGDIARLSPAGALLLTRLGYVEDPDGFRQAFMAGGGSAEAWEGLVGYQMHLAGGLADVARRSACATGS
jgi:4-amino-4-deoxy-L-arabinose transferase-like glycosyltransferase